MNSPFSEDGQGNINHRDHGSLNRSADGTLRPSASGRIVGRRNSDGSVTPVGPLDGVADGSGNSSGNWDDGLTPDQKATVNRAGLRVFLMFLFGFISLGVGFSVAGSLAFLGAGAASIFATISVFAVFAFAQVLVLNRIAVNRRIGVYEFPGWIVLGVFAISFAAGGLGVSSAGGAAWVFIVVGAVAGVLLRWRLGR